MPNEFSKELFRTSRKRVDLSLVPQLGIFFSSYKIKYSYPPYSKVSLFANFLICEEFLVTLVGTDSLLLLFSLLIREFPISRIFSAGTNQMLIRRDNCTFIKISKEINVKLKNLSETVSSLRSGSDSQQPGTTVGTQRCLPPNKR